MTIIKSYVSWCYFLFISATADAIAKLAVWVMLTVMTVLLLVGIFWMRKLVKVDV